MLNKRAKMGFYRSPDYQASFKSLGLLIQGKFNIEFQDEDYGGHLGFSIGRFLVILNLHVTSLLPMKFRVS